MRSLRLNKSPVPRPSDGKGTERSGPPQAVSVAIVGLGYVGLPLSLQFARAGVRVVGLDIDSSKVQALNAGRSYIKHVLPATIADAVQGKRFDASTDCSRARHGGAVATDWTTPRT